MSVDAMLTDLREARWVVEIASDLDGWILVITSLDNLSHTATYEGESLARIVAKAWAGERGDL
jgi:hypothetical protein